jgi:DNA replication protein
MNQKFIHRLIESKAINIKEYIISNYVKLGLDETSALLLIHIYNFKAAGSNFLSIKQLKEKMSIPFVTCSDLVLDLVQRNFIAFEIDINDQGITKEKYTLDPLYQKIFQLITSDTEEIQAEADHNEVMDLIRIIETEFGRTISSFELELINSWIHEYQYSFEVIKIAIREAIASNAYNLKYVDRILLNWQKLNIKSPEDAAAYTKTYKRFETKQEAKPVEQQEYVSWMK